MVIVGGFGGVMHARIDGLMGGWCDGMLDEIMGVVWGIVECYGSG